MNECLNWEKINNLPSLKISSGSMEAVKWIALLSMTIDHINWFFFDTSIYPAYCFGRLALPLFAFIFAYNLAQPDAFARGLYTRVLKRLIIFGILATPGYIAMRHLPFIFPLNIMFMLGAATACLYFLELGGASNRIIAISIFLIGGLFVEYSWVGIIFCIASWFFCKKTSITTLLVWLVTYVLLGASNGNNWAMLTLPLIFLAARMDLKITRIPYFFYIYYPLHLIILSMLSRLIT